MSAACPACAVDEKPPPPASVEAGKSHGIAYVAALASCDRLGVVPVASMLCEEHGKLYTHARERRPSGATS